MSGSAREVNKSSLTTLIQKEFSKGSKVPFLFLNGNFFQLPAEGPSAHAICVYFVPRSPG